MARTHVDYKVELFGSHCVAGVCGIAGFMEAMMLVCLNAGGLYAFLLCVGTVRAITPVLLFWVVQPCAFQTLRYIVITQGSLKLQGLIQQIWGKAGDYVSLRISQ